MDERQANDAKIADGEQVKVSFLVAEFRQSLCGQFRQLPTSQSLASRSLARSLIRQSSAKAAVRTSLAYTLTDRNGRFSVWDSQNRLVSCLMGAVPKYSVRTPEVSSGGGEEEWLFCCAGSLGSEQDHDHRGPD